MKHRGADTVERETQDLVAQANRCLGDEFNTSSGEDDPPPSRPPGRDGFETGGSPDRPPPAPQRPQQTPRRPQPMPQRPTPDQQPPQQTPRRPPLTPQAERIERICDLQRLAQWIFRRYKTGRPIARVRVVNAAQPTYLLFFSGMEIDRIGQATTPLQALIAWGNFQGFDAYRIGILNAVADLPRGTHVILAGHSQGGMEAQQIVAHLIARNGLRVPQVISYGAPITVGRTPGTSYQHVRALDDWVIGLDREFNLSATEIIRANRRSPGPAYVLSRSRGRPESLSRAQRVDAEDALLRDRCDDDRGIPGAEPLRPLSRRDESAHLIQPTAEPDARSLAGSLARELFLGRARAGSPVGDRPADPRAL